MGAKDLAKIEQLNWILAAVLIVGAMVLFTTPVVTGVAAGALLACLNFSVIRRVVAASLRRTGNGRALLQLILVGKMGLLFGAIALVMKFVPLDPIAFAVGISVFLISIAVVSTRTALSAEQEDDAQAAPPKAEDGRA